METLTMVMEKTVRQPVKALLIIGITIISFGMVWVTYLVAKLIEDLQTGIESRHQYIGQEALYTLGNIIFGYLLLGKVLKKLLDMFME